MTGTLQPTTLITEARFADPDAAYRLIADAHRGLPEAESAAFNARLVLILANQIGDPAVLAEAMELARRAAAPIDTAPPAVAS